MSSHTSSRSPLPWRIPIVDLAADWSEVGPSVEAAVLRVLRSGQYVLGPETVALEAEIADRIGTRFAVGVGSGTEALTLALRAVGIGPGDEVVTSAFTYFATVEAILLAGATPVFADLEEGGFGLDPAAVQAAIGPRTAAILPVHLFGRCADMPAIGEIAARHGLAVVEDAAQSIAAARAGRRAGTFGTAAAFSFYPSKNLGAAGDAGCITTDDPGVAERARLLRSHGSDDGHTHRLLGTTSRLDSVQAAVLRAKLPYLKAWTEGRARNAALYARELAGCADLELPRAGEDESPVWSQYTLRSPRAEGLRRALGAEGIEWRHYYPEPAYRQPALGDLRLPAGTCPRAEAACAEVLSIPVRWSCPPPVIREIAAVIRRALCG